MNVVQKKSPMDSWAVSTINVSSMRNFYNAHEQDIIINFIEYPVVSAANSVLLRTGEFDGLRGTRVLAQLIND
jgi:hypothetical protein